MPNNNAIFWRNLCKILRLCQDIVLSPQRHRQRGQQLRRLFPNTAASASKTTPASSSTTKAAAAVAARAAATMTGTTRTGKRYHPTNPPFLLETPLYKGNERRWVGGVQPNINPTSTQHAKLSWRVASSSLMVGQWWVDVGLNASNPTCSKPLVQRLS